jgi:predicted amidophosphoribosyltransferase
LLSDLIVPVPLHRFRLWKRHYNQAAVLGQRLARFSGRPCDPLALEPKRPPTSQGGMKSAKARRKNVLGAFRVPDAKMAAVKGLNILLVDDVFTRALKRASAARVDALTLARVVRAASSDI